MKMAKICTDLSCLQTYFTNNLYLVFKLYLVSELFFGISKCHLHFMSSLELFWCVWCILKLIFLRRGFKDSSNSVRHLFTSVILFLDFVLGRHVNGMLNRFYFSSEMELYSLWIIIWIHLNLNSTSHWNLHIIARSCMLCAVFSLVANYAIKCNSLC